MVLTTKALWFSFCCFRAFSGELSLATKTLWFSPNYAVPKVSLRFCAKGIGVLGAGPGGWRPASPNMSLRHEAPGKFFSKTWTSPGPPGSLVGSPVANLVRGSTRLAKSSLRRTLTKKFFAKTRSYLSCPELSECIALLRLDLNCLVLLSISAASHRIAWHCIAFASHSTP